MDGSGGSVGKKGKKYLSDGINPQKDVSSGLGTSTLLPRLAVVVELVTVLDDVVASRAFLVGRELMETVDWRALGVSRVALEEEEAAPAPFLELLLRGRSMVEEEERETGV